LIIRKYCFSLISCSQNNCEYHHNTSDVDQIDALRLTSDAVEV